MSHVALYGKIKLIREYCDHCQVNTLVVDGHRQCCGKQSKSDPSSTRRMSIPQQKRSTLSNIEKFKIL